MNATTQTVTPIQKAIDAVGGQGALARLLKVHPALVSQWRTGRRPVAAHHILSIEAMTQVSRHELRPDIFGMQSEPDPETGRIVPVEVA
ncbi:helix-turn-helix domain-containing protein [Stenotrophomonas lactitubi]|uniref:transcriptional regulator n=1 Tax=Stenotrophomonas lactitubi TaxID=2045214 RepID=UPI0032078AF7